MGIGNIVNLAKDRLAKNGQTREQMKRANELVEVVKETVEFLKTKGLKTFEMRLVCQLMAERVNNVIQNHTDIKDYAEIDILDEKPKPVILNPEHVIGSPEKPSV